MGFPCAKPRSKGWERTNVLKNLHLFYLDVQSSLTRQKNGFFKELFLVIARTFLQSRENLFHA